MTTAAACRIQDKINTTTNGKLWRYTPSLKVLAFSNGIRFVNFQMGEKFEYYDLASLTKIIFTTSIMMKLIDQGKIKLTDEVISILPWWPHPNINIGQLLSHSAGNPWWRPFYKKISSNKRIKGRWEELRVALQAQKLEVADRFVYSDIDFLLLAYVIEAKMGKNIIDVWTEYKLSLSLTGMDFHKNNRPNYVRTKYAPTEKCSWRKKTLQGEVHDDNAWSLGGVATHAGLFGTIASVGIWALTLREALLNSKGSALASQSIIKSFTRRQTHFSKGDWGFGFMKPSHGKASCGQFFSEASFGHTGFTGTSFWMDPTKDLIVIILSHRVHPSRKNVKFNLLRPLIHDWIVEEQSRV